MAATRASKWRVVARARSWIPSAGTRLGAALTLAVVAGGVFADAAGSPLSVPGDFDANGTVDMADHELFREAFGGTDSLYDLNADGRVDLEDFYALAELTHLPPAPGDFDASGTVDMTDHELFREAFGGPDSLYDLNADGRVDLEDFYLLVELSRPGEGQPPTGEAAEEAAEEAGETGEPPGPLYTLQLTGEAVRVTFPYYTVEVSHGSPFGITSLRLEGQPVDFADAQLPLADWEWFWFGEPGRGRTDQSIKLLQAEWGLPQIEQREDLVILTYRRTDVLLVGLAVEVVFRFSALHSQFDVTYTIDNRSGRALEAPYIMVGFPGFANNRWVSQVVSARENRQTPYGSFLVEARESGLQEYLLLRHDVALKPGKPDPLRGDVVITFGRRAFTLSSFFFSLGREVTLYSAHTNKDRYLTSHLYVTNPDIASGGRRSLTVHYLATVAEID